MIKRFVTIILALLCLSSASANKQEIVKLDSDGRREAKVELEGLGYATFRYMYPDAMMSNVGIVSVSIDNLTMSPQLALLVFRHSMDERAIKSSVRKPKIRFEKKFPQRSVRGVSGIDRPVDFFMPAEDPREALSMTVPFGGSKQFEMTVYVAKYNPGKYHKKGLYDVDFKIFEEKIFDFTVELVGWTENDPDYIQTSECVSQYVESLKDVTFCNNKKHRLSLEAQQAPYLTRRDSLIAVITSRMEENNWMSTDAPHVAYSKLIKSLSDVNFDDHIKDCGKHIIKPPRHRCSRCSVETARELCHELDDTYQLLLAGRLSKDEAVKIARGVETCLSKRASKRPDVKEYSARIKELYNRIVQ
ncbi:hypothetical protein [Duncaniella dubosii]|uniref:hypothetical protein n=1 Tax=Duncaniella dubosii TaxID=2518971 RepID=UPI0023F2605E|nr:hypothetical protein [Duncaniella dubosii]MCX4285284.1 hypothetical protein [Duncaniella dubosii]